MGLEGWGHPSPGQPLGAWLEPHGAASHHHTLSHGVSGCWQNTTQGWAPPGPCQWHVALVEPCVLSHGGLPMCGHRDEYPEPGVVQDPLSSSPPDNAMDGGAQQSSLREPPGPGSTEQDERDGGEGPPELKRSQPLFIHGSSRQPLEEEPRASSLPSIPNPFPELCSPSNSPILSSPALGQGPPREGASHVVKVFGEDGACRSLEAAAGTTARQLCETLVRRTRALQDHSWALVELHQHLGLGEPPARC
uniref:Ras-associating domain-containing protein n=1 Tax=Strigops habroptila TaxID=2489341 RepID=A0A672U0K0_STRHB